MSEKRKTGRPRKTPADEKTTDKTKITDIAVKHTEKQVKENKSRDWVRQLSADYQNPHIKPGDNSRFVRNAMASLSLPPIDTSDPDQVEQRCYEYLQFCADNDRRPQIVGLANWLGVTRITLYNWANEVEKTRPKHTVIIKRIYSLMEEMWTEYMQYGKISPPTAIFLAKNWYGYRDETSIVVTPNNPLQNLDNETATKRIMDAIPTDDDLPES